MPVLSIVDKPRFGPSLSKKIKYAGLFRGEVPPQEVHCIFGEVGGDNRTDQLRTATSLQHLHTQTGNCKHWALLHVSTFLLLSFITLQYVRFLLQSSDKLWQTNHAMRWLQVEQTESDNETKVFNLGVAFTWSFKTGDRSLDV